MTIGGTVMRSGNAYPAATMGASSPDRLAYAP